MIGQEIHSVPLKRGFSTGQSTVGMPPSKIFLFAASMLAKVYVPISKAFPVFLRASMLVTYFPLIHFIFVRSIY